jgi:PAS domain-containing protein
MGFDFCFRIPVCRPGNEKILVTAFLFRICIFTGMLFFVYYGLQSEISCDYARNIALLSVIPFFTVPLVLTNDCNHLIWADVVLNERQNTLVIQHGTGFWVFWIYSFGLIISGIYNLFSSIYEFPSYYRSQAGTLLIATVIPVIGNLMYVTALNPVLGFDWTPLSFMFSGMVITFGIVKYRMFDLVPIARNKLIDTMDDGVMVVNSEGFIENINPAVSRIFNLSESVMHKPFYKIFSAYPQFICTVGSSKMEEVDLEIGRNETVRFYHARISPVRDHTKKEGKISGYLIEIHDISSIKMAENELKEINNKLIAEVEERGKLIDDLDAFAHTVAHDLRNSLGNIYSSVEMITG